jgi:hypothetical protein
MGVSLTSITDTKLPAAHARIVDGYDLVSVGQVQCGE